MAFIKFNGKNYIYWPWSVEIFLRGKSFFDHLLYQVILSVASASDATSLDTSTTSATFVAWII
jgi:hypothetical protein